MAVKNSGAGQAPIVVQAQGLKKYYTISRKGLLAGQRQTLHALDGVSLSIHRGEIFGIVGESGWR
jgi:peptide/nickel transport system ATP-binding protein